MRACHKDGSVPAPRELAGSWEVRFAGSAVTFDKLADWTTRPEEAIRHDSGTAVYRQTFLHQPPAAGSHRWFLDLGKVRDLATVRLNGKTLGTLWLAPWRLEITAAIRPGRNELEIEVVNAWHNRLLGDRALPAGRRQTFLSKDTLAKNASLLPAGLLGPVTLRAAQAIDVK